MLKRIRKHIDNYLDRKQKKIEAKYLKQEYDLRQSNPEKYATMATVNVTRALQEDFDRQSTQVAAILREDPSYN